MRVEVHLTSQSQPMVSDDVRNTYVKDSLFCVLHENNTVEKYPIADIFRITESYK